MPIYIAWINLERPTLHIQQPAQQQHYANLSYFEKRFIELDLEVEQQKLVSPLTEAGWAWMLLQQFATRELALSHLFSLLSDELDKTHGVGATGVVGPPNPNGWSDCGKGCHIGIGAAIMVESNEPVVVRSDEHMHMNTPWPGHVTAEFRLQEISEGNQP